MRNSGDSTLVTRLSSLSVKLQKYLASAGIGSRRRCEELIGAGRVLVNRVPAVIGQRITPGKDQVLADGVAVAPQQQKIVIMINKPVGVLSATRRGREQGTLITELIASRLPQAANRPEFRSPIPDPRSPIPRLFPVGRLDRDSEGLMLLTNDGDLALKLSHPRYEKEKEYEVELDRPFVMAQAIRLTRGVRIDDVRMRALRVSPKNPEPRIREGTVGSDSHPRSGGVHLRSLAVPSLRIVLAEGHKRQIRRMFSILGYRVTKLRRTRIAGLELGDLKPGEWRQLTPEEIKVRLQSPSPKPLPPNGTLRSLSSPSRGPGSGGKARKNRMSCPFEKFSAL